jgi:hypothetical protein
MQPRKLKVFVQRHTVHTETGDIVTFVIRSTQRAPRFQFNRQFASLSEAGKQAALFAAPNGSALFRHEEWHKVSA